MHPYQVNGSEGAAHQPDGISMHAAESSGKEGTAVRARCSLANVLAAEPPPSNPSTACPRASLYKQHIIIHRRGGDTRPRGRQAACTHKAGRKAARTHTHTDTYRSIVLCLSFIFSHKQSLPPHSQGDGKIGKKRYILSCIFLVHR